MLFIEMDPELSWKCQWYSLVKSERLVEGLFLPAHVSAVPLPIAEEEFWTPPRAGPGGRRRAAVEDLDEAEPSDESGDDGDVDPGEEHPDSSSHAPSDDEPSASGLGSCMFNDCSVLAKTKQNGHQTKRGAKRPSNKT